MAQAHGFGQVADAGFAAVGGGDQGYQPDPGQVAQGFEHPGQSIGTIEQRPQLRLRTQPLLQLQTALPGRAGARLDPLSAREVYRSALRARPDRIVLDEITDDMTLDLPKAMSAGHDGSIGAIQADSPANALSRIEAGALTTGHVPIENVWYLIAVGPRFILHQDQFPDGALKITRVTEIMRRHLRAKLVNVQE